MEIQNWIRASFLDTNGFEAGVFHPTTEKATKYLNLRLAQHHKSSQGKWVARRFGTVLYACKRQVQAVYQPVALDLAKPEVFTIVCWSHDGTGIQLAYSLDEVATLIQYQGQVDPSVLSLAATVGQSRFYSSTKKLVLTVTRETVEKYRQLREVMVKLSERRQLQG